MKCLLQNVTYARVIINQEIFTSINKGLLIFVGFEKNDTENVIHKTITKILNYRIFNDSNNKMNLNIQNITGEILLVPQFTLAANTKNGLRPDFSTAENPEKSNYLFKYLVEYTRKHFANNTQCGLFGANMQIELINNGPVTFLIT